MYRSVLCIASLLAGLLCGDASAQCRSGCGVGQAQGRCSINGSSTQLRPTEELSTFRLFRQPGTGTISDGMEMLEAMEDKIESLQAEIDSRTPPAPVDYDRLAQIMKDQQSPVLAALTELTRRLEISEDRLAQHQDRWRNLRGKVTIPVSAWVSK